MSQSAFDPDAVAARIFGKPPLDQAERLCGTLMESAVSDALLAAVDHVAKARVPPRRKMPSLEVPGEVTVLVYSKSPRYNVNDALARENAQCFHFPEGLRVVRVRHEAVRTVRLDGGDRHLLLMQKKNPIDDVLRWCLDVKFGFVPPSGRGAGHRTRGRGPDGLLER